MKDVPPRRLAARNEKKVGIRQWPMSLSNNETKKHSSLTLEGRGVALGFG